MDILKIVLTIIYVIDCIGLTVIVLMQEGRADGLSGAIAGGAETFFGKNKGRTIEQKLIKVTKALASVFFVLSLVATIIVMFVK